MTFLNFGEDLIRWINLLLNNFSAVINHCGNISKKFNIGRGARQGDPIASYVFIICIEILMHKLRMSENIDFFKVNDAAHGLEIYADDCTIFLQPDSASLRNAVEILGNFYKLSGLKISVSKTKAIWFGLGHDNKEKLCLDLKLDWVRTFRLLGIDFHNNLENMEDNFNSKIKEIKKLLNGWFYRALSPYGKIALIKSLALSKLSHIALVIPSLSKVALKELENIIYSFLWDNKPDKVNRKDTCLTERAGGLGMIDIKLFWSSFKFSWFRRLIDTKAFWPTVLKHSVQKIIQKKVEIIDILQFGPAKLEFIGKKFGNKFWKEVFCSAVPLMQGAIFCTPEKILMAPIMENFIFQRNDRSLKPANFPTLADKNLIFADFIKNDSNQFLDREAFLQNTGCEISENSFIEIKHILCTTLRQIGLQVAKLPVVTRPIQPLLINVATITKRGCNRYYKILNKKSVLSSNSNSRERKWHTELGRVYGVNVWNGIYQQCSDIKNDNKLKWLQYQINRGSLFTNFRVNKFKPQISPNCSFCTNSIELISHLFFDCDIVLAFWLEVKNWILQFKMNIPLEIKTLIFGDEKKQVDDPCNYIILVAKYYIWRSKFQNTTLTLSAFKNFLKFKLEDHKNALEYVDKVQMFDRWLNLFNSL